MQGVEYDTPADEAAKNACKVETVVERGEQEHRIRVARSRRERCCAGLSSRAAASGWTSGATTRTDSRSIARTTSTATAPRRVPLAQRGRQPDRPDREGKDHGLEADLGRRGVEGAGSGTRRRRCGPARDRSWRPPTELAERACPRTSSRRSPRRPQKRAEQLAALQETAHRLERADDLESIRRHVSARDSGRSRSGAGEGPDALRKRDGDPRNDGCPAECGQARVPAGPRHDPARGDLEVHRAAARDRSRKADRRRDERHALDALRPGERRRAA